MDGVNRSSHISENHRHGDVEKHEFDVLNDSPLCPQQIFRDCVGGSRDYSPCPHHPTPRELMAWLRGLPAVRRVLSTLVELTTANNGSEKWGTQ